MIVRQIKYNSPEYKEAVILRDLILRQPLGLKLDPKDLLKEKDDYHIGCFEDNRLLGVLILTPKDKEIIQMRQVAVDNKQQHKGVGSALVQFAERIASAHRFSKIVLSARTTALNFYLKMGYKTVGEEYISKSTNILHIEMIKSLSTSKNHRERRENNSLLD